MDFKKASVEQTLQALDCSREGLSQAEAKKRLEIYGQNKIEEKKQSIFQKIAHHFFSPMSIIILIAAILSFAINHLEDAGIISFLFILNGAISYYTEAKADAALATLAKKISVLARVFRSKSWDKIESELLVPGDLIELKGGDIVPADAKIIEGSIEVDQSALTGESLPVELKSGQLAYASSLVHRGLAKALIALTGEKTTFGKTAKLSQMQKPQSHLDKSIFKIGEYLMILALMGAVLIFVAGYLLNTPIAESLLFALTLLVASVPAAMPAVLATIMAVGALHLAKKHVVVRHLSALEELAGVSVICSDKTGTITKNQMTVGEVWAYKCTQNQLLISARSCMPKDSEDPIDLAIYAHAPMHEKFGWRMEKYVPADSERKRASAYLISGKSRLLIIKGAPQKVIPLCKLSPKARKLAFSQVDQMGKNGFRAIAIAQKKVKKSTDNETGATLLGIIPLYDPPRDDAARTIRLTKAMGIDIRMVTGDHAAAARYISSKIGLVGELITSAQMEAQNNISKSIEKIKIFAEVLPEQKFAIVKAFQKAGYSVAVTGDGVNDAPALRQAEVGIAVARATQVARMASDLVLTEKGISVLVNGIDESRAIFERMHNYVLYRLSETFRILFLVPFAVLALGFFPLAPLQLVLLSLLNDIPILAMATDNVQFPNAPEKWRVKRLLSVTSILGAIGLISSGLLLLIAYFVLKLPLESIQTLLFLKLSLSGHFMVFATRTKTNWFKAQRPPMLLLGAIVLTQIAATILALTGTFVAPIHFGLIFAMWVYVFAAFFITDYLKVKTYELADRMNW
ncbi:MAG: plasma-membrane proton-efflux P-type ATPase [Candidatus Micrarchaeota archaeon]